MWPAVDLHSLAEVICNSRGVLSIAEIFVVLLRIYIVVQTVDFDVCAERMVVGNGLGGDLREDDREEDADYVRLEHLANY